MTASVARDVVFRACGAVLLACLAVLILAPTLPASAWPRLPDRRVVLTIKGTRVVLPDEPLLFQYGSLNVFQGSTFPMQEVIAQPERFRWLVDTPDEVSLSFSVGWGGKAGAAASPEALLRQPWRGRWGISVINEIKVSRRPDGVVVHEPRRDRSCNLVRRQGYAYEHRNVTRPHEPVDLLQHRSFQSCAGPVLVGFQLPLTRFPPESLPLAQERLVEFFGSVLPDHPVEVYQ